MLTANATYTLNGVLIREKIIPDSAVWKNDEKAKKAGFSGAGYKYKANLKLSRGSGKIKGVTVHNTGRGRYDGKYSDSGTGGVAEVYTRATYPNENMNSARVHFYVDEFGAWQNLKAGTGLTPADPVNCAEVGWHSGDGTYGAGNNTTVSMELIQDSTDGAYNKAVEDNGARIAAYILYENGLTINELYTHTYFINAKDGYARDSVDEQNTYKHPGVGKYCPACILPHWQTFKALVAAYLCELSSKQQPVKEQPAPETNAPTDEIKAGTLVSIREGAAYWSGAKIPAWVMAQRWYVLQVAQSGRAVINQSEDGKSAIMSPIDVKNLVAVVQPPQEKPSEDEPPKTDENPPAESDTPPQEDETPPAEEQPAPETNPPTEDSKSDDEKPPDEPPEEAPATEPQDETKVKRSFIINLINKILIWLAKLRTALGITKQDGDDK